MQTIWLEFKHENGAVAANGTEITFYIDGRWNMQTTHRKIREQVNLLRQTRGSRYSNQLFIGYSKPRVYNGNGSEKIYYMKDPEPPAWAGTKVVPPSEWRTYA